MRKRAGHEVDHPQGRDEEIGWLDTPTKGLVLLSTLVETEDNGGHGRAYKGKLDLGVRKRTRKVCFV